MKISIKAVEQSDIEVAFTLTKELVKYHDALDIFTLTPQRFSELIKNKALISYVAYADSVPVGIINMFYKYTTFSGRKILYIEDLYAKREYRGYGIGKKLFEKAKEVAAENDCEQIELKCAVWNKNSAEFYKMQGMTSDSYWKTYILPQSSF